MPNNREEVGSRPDAPVEAASVGQEAFRAIYDREFDYVWHSLRRLGIPARDLPDVTHDVFLKLHRSLTTYDASRPFRPWLFGVLFRVASDHQHLGRNAREVLDDMPLDIRDSAPGPEQSAGEREEWRIVDRALDAMDLPHRVVLVMHDFSGHSAHDVARELAIPLKTVYSRLRTARARFVLTAHQVQLKASVREGNS
jgi:RNA polymerase sigma-70 factor (ECF subfamily)